jgi:hypothetical protein
LRLLETLELRVKDLERREIASMSFGTGILMLVTFGGLGIWVLIFIKDLSLLALWSLD